jgi:hypothetical protein
MRETALGASPDVCAAGPSVFTEAISARLNQVISFAVGRHDRSVGNV